MLTIFTMSLPHSLLNHVLTKADNNPESVLQEIDNFCWKQGNWMMNVGDEKGQIINTILTNVKPKTCLELGTFCGYSAILTAQHLGEGGKLYTIDPNETTTAVAKQLVAKAGLEDKVVFITGTAEDSIGELSEKYGVNGFDYVFIDHIKELYYSDLKLIEQADLLRDGATVVADNVIIFGGHVEDYLEHVRKSGNYDSVLHKAHMEYDKQIIDGVEVSVYSKKPHQRDV